VIRPHVQRHGGAASAATLILQREQPPAGEQPLRVAVPSPGDTAVLDLKAGQWMLDSEASGFWHARQYLTVTNDRDVQVELWPSAVLQGKIRSNASRAPSEVLVGFDGFSKAKEPVDGAAACTVTGAAFVCELPAGTLDMRLRAPGHIGRFLWNVSLSPSKPTDVGEVSLKVGQSIVGKIELPARSKLDVTQTVLRARPSGTIEGAGPVTAGSLLLPQVTKAEKRGIFHIDGVMPGEYAIRATHPGGLVSEEVTVVVREGFAAIDLTEPIRMATPKRIRLALDPPLTPSGEPWRVEIDRAVGPTAYDTVSVSRGNGKGEWSSPPLAPGQYQVAVGASFDDTWVREPVTIGTADEHRTLALTARTVAGHVSMGDKPLAATLVFGDDSGRIAKAQSNQDGNFSVSLPDAARERWNVTVTSESPFIDRTVADVPTPRGTPLEIRVPNTALTGKVLDATTRAPLEYTLLSIVWPAGSVQPTTGRDGTFVAYGLDSGTYRISGETLTHDVDEVTIEFRADDPPANLVLLAHARREIHGQVLSALGPVAGATVVVCPIDPPALFLHPTTTGADGAFTAKMGEHASEVDVIVIAPGFAFSFARMRSEDGSLRVSLDQRGGTLILHSAADQTFLVHGGAAIATQFLQNRWPSQTTSAEGGGMLLRAPMLAPGVYAFCDVPPAGVDAFDRSGGQFGATRCVSGALDPLGTLTLDLASPPAQRAERSLLGSR
jgi:hypothetical protein